ncbi:hypothetical protein L1987_07006 [Smallanthus sonchifolius]|uniref:Uncharacterized protein n=1 Tax=Smallanthus sonchifolius TaxID=185202 RepID=A0ACB9JZP5_9ASTR|nr:hypothetical protein L1987_07006 [Smallanthus sonchifolius]
MFLRSSPEKRLAATPGDDGGKCVAGRGVFGSRQRGRMGSRQKGGIRVDYTCFSLSASNSTFSLPSSSQKFNLPLKIVDLQTDSTYSKKSASKYL